MLVDKVVNPSIRFTKIKKQNAGAIQIVVHSAGGSDSVTETTWVTVTAAQQGGWWWWGRSGGCRRGGTASLKVGTHCQTTAPALFCTVHPSVSFFYCPIFLRVIDHGPEIKHSQCKIINKSDPKFSTQLSI